MLKRLFGETQSYFVFVEIFLYLLLTIVVFKLAENSHNPECQTHQDYENVAVCLHVDRMILADRQLLWIYNA